MLEKKKSVVPLLRFPEFWDAGEWDEKPLGQVVRFLDGQRKPIKESDRAFMQGQYPYYGASGIIDYINDFIFDDDLILLGEDGENIVSRNLPLAFKVSGKCWVNNHAHVLKPNKPHHLNFLVQYLENLSYIKYNSGGAQPKLTQAICQKIPLLLPIPDEQQKIADCLSSLDEVIDLEAQKLEALKAHKKGLMQQLFPREGETTPCLRFPEFRDAGEWVVKRLKHISPAIFDGTHQTPNYIEKGVPFFSVENIVSGNKNKYISMEDYMAATIKNKPENGDILITRIGNIGFSKVVDWDYEFSIYVTLAVVKKSELFNSQYLHCYFQSEYYQKEILKKSLLNAVPCKINMDELQKTKVLLPSLPEQQKIADCLASLDEVINLQIQKLDALNAHKKGLMQQLFPQEVD